MNERDRMRWKWAIGIAAFLMVTLMVAVYLILASYDYNKLKPRIAQAVWDATGRELTLGGAVKLAIGLSPSLVVADVMLANAPWASQPQMIIADELRIQIDLLPLLIGDVEFERIVLVDVEVLLETDARGRSNWEFLPGNNSKKSIWPVGELGIKNVKIVKLQLTFHSGQRGSTSRFTLDSLDAWRKPSSSDLTINLKGTANGQPIALSGKTGPILNLLAHRPMEFDLLGKVSNATVEISGIIGAVFKLEGIDGKVTFSGTDLAGLGIVAGMDMPKTKAFQLTAHLRGSAKTLTLDDITGNLFRSSVKVTVKGKVSNLISLTGVDLEVRGSGKNLAEVGPIVETKLPKTGPFIVKGRLSGSSKTLSLDDAEGTVSRGSLRLAVNGKIEDLLGLSGIAFEVKGSGKELAEIGPLIEKKLLNFGSFDVTGNLRGSSQALALDGLSVIIGKSDFNGSAKVEFRRRPKITLVLESGLVDVTPFIGEATKEEKKVGKKGGYNKRLFSDDPLPFEVLKKVDAHIVLKARHIKAREAQFDLGHLTLTLRDNDLSIDNLEAVYKGTKLSGNLHLYPGSSPHIATKFLVQGFDLGGYLREIGASDRARGHIDIAADLKSNGDSAHTLVTNLDGTIGLVMGKGYLTGWLNLLAINLSKKVIAFWGKHQEARNIKCGVVDFDIKSGIATSQAFVFDTKIAILTAEGDINLKTEQVNFLLSPKAKSAGLTLLNTNLRVTGSMQDPKVRPDMASLAFKGARALSTLVVGPVGLLAPFVTLGAHEKHPCDVGKLGNKVH
jgi:uncharacterized protein involved in outer membrane biogenesis